MEIKKKCTDQTAHQPSLISAFVKGNLKNIVLKFVSCKHSIFWLVSVAGQASLSLTWSETGKTGFLASRCIGLSTGLCYCIDHFEFK